MKPEAAGSSSASPERRLFFALPLSPEAVLSLRPAADRLSRYRNILKIVSPDHYHLTMKFLGSTAPARFENLVRQYGDLELRVPRVPYRLKGLGAFPSPSRPHVLWAGIEAEAGLLEVLRDRIESLARDLGFPAEDRDFSPHLTLARVKRGERVPRDLVEYLGEQGTSDFAESAFDRAVLFESRLMPHGSVYTEIVSKELKG